MATEVIAARRRIIRRPRLTAMLDESSARIRLLIAPAGYGKTTLAREWLGVPERHDVWYRGGPASADVAALAAGIAEAAALLIPDAGKRMRERLRATGHPEEDVDILAEIFAEDVQDWPPDAWVAIDDYQFAMESVASERFVDLLTQGTPLQMLITSRRRPSWATARRILYGEIHEIDRRALAMQDNEGRAVLGQKGERIDALLGKARGWPAVLGLASLAENLELPEHDLPDALYQYFAEELLQGLAPAVQISLSQLAVLPTLSPALVSELLSARATITLSEGVRVGAITKSGSDFELHPLLREFLVTKFQEFAKQEVEPFAHDAVRALTENERWDEAFDVISHLGVPQLMSDLIAVALEDLLRDGRVQTISQWLDFAAANHISSHVIDLAESETAFRQAHYARAEALARSAAEGLEARELRAKALIRAAQSAMLDTRDEQALHYFRQARLAASTDHSRLEALVGECFAILELGLASESEEVFAQLGNFAGGGIEMRVRQSMVQLVRAARLGGIGSALQVAAEIRPLLTDIRDPLVATSFLNTFAHLLVLGARYEEALEVSQTELEFAQRYRLDFVLPHALLVDASAHIGVRDFAHALEKIETAEELGRQSSDVHIAMYGAGLRARIAITKQDFGTALAQSAQRWERPGSNAMRAELLAYRCLASACVGDAAETRARVGEIQGIAGAGIEAAVLASCAMAIIALTESRSTAASAASDALSAVFETGAFDCFITAARGSPAFLTAALHSPEDTTIVADVLARANDFKLARSAGLTLNQARAGPIGTLTPREFEVAQLVAQGHTNRAIADRLYISDATVKVHVRHILEKMGARSRSEVAARISTQG